MKVEAGTLSTAESINKPLEDTGMDDATIGTVLELPPSEQEKIEHFRDMAKKRACTYVKLIAEDKASESALLDMVASTTVGKMRGELVIGSTKIVAVWYDLKLSGESVTAPHVRLPPYRSADMKKKIMSVVQGREDPTSLHPGDAFFIFNGFKSIDTQLTGHFSDDSGERPKSMTKNKRTITLSYAESSLLDRRSGGHGPVCQNEHLLVISKAPLEIPSHMPRVSRGHYQGSNLGDNIGYVTYQPWNASWQLQFGEKKALYGKHRTDVGGETVGLKTEDGDDKAKRSDNDMLPVCYHAMPKELYDTLTSEYPLIASIDLTPGEGVNALVHVRKRLPYLGVCFTSSHVEFLQKRIENLVYRGMRDEEDADLYEPALANLLHCKKKTQKKGQARGQEGVEEGGQEERRGAR